MNPIILILGVIVIVLIYVLYTYLSNPATSLTALANLNTNIPELKMPSTSSSANYAYGIWVSINSWNNNNFKPIFSRKSDTTGSREMTTMGATLSLSSWGTTNPQIGLYLDKTTPSLSCFIDQLTSGTDPILITSNFPLQTWVYVVISVQGTYVDLYLQGKLVKSIKLNQMPVQPSGDKGVALGFGSSTSATNKVDANVALFNYYPTPLNPQQVWSNYMKGNGQNMTSGLSTYGINVDLTANGVAQNSYTIF